MTGANHLQLDTPRVARFARFSRALGSFGATFAMVMAVDGRDEEAGRDDKSQRRKVGVAST